MSNSAPSLNDLTINLDEQFGSPYITNKPFRLNSEQVEQIERLSMAAKNEKDEKLRWMEVVGELLVAAGSSKETPANELNLDQIGFMIKELSSQVRHYDFYEHHCDFMLQSSKGEQS
jgi:hypothetical protein